MDADAEQMGGALDMLAARQEGREASFRRSQAIEAAERLVIQFDTAVGVADDEGECRPLVVRAEPIETQLLHDDRERPEPWRALYDVDAILGPARSDPDLSAALARPAVVLPPLLAQLRKQRVEVLDVGQGLSRIVVHENGLAALVQQRHASR